MAITKLQSNKLICPYCQEIHVPLAIDPGLSGTEQCEYCNNRFTYLAIGDHIYEIRRTI